MNRSKLFEQVRCEINSIVRLTTSTNQIQSCTTLTVWRKQANPPVTYDKPQNALVSTIHRKMENTDSKQADIPRLMLMIYKYITDTISIMENDGIDPTRQISLSVTKQHELATWDLIFDLSSILIVNYFPKEPDYRYLRLYNIVPKWKLQEDQRTAFYAKYLELENELEEWQSFIYKEKTMEVLNGIYTKLGNVAITFSELATMREIERMKRI